LSPPVIERTVKLDLWYDLGLNKTDEVHPIVILQKATPRWFEYKVFRIDLEIAKSLEDAWVRGGQIKARLCGRADSGKLLFQSDVPLAMGILSSPSGEHVFLSPLGGAPESSTGTGGTLVSPILATGNKNNFVIRWRLESPIHFKFSVPYQALEELTNLEAEIVR
jgi:hypothetical protein